MDSPFLKASIHVNETASVIKMRSLDTIVYEQDSQMALSCFHYDSLFSQCFQKQKKRSELGHTSFNLIALFAITIEQMASSCCGVKRGPLPPLRGCLSILCGAE